MTHLTLVNLSGDGRRLLMVSDKGVEFTLDVDDNLRSALRGDRTRFGQLEIKMDASLRPRDIQSRIRSGESPESVASAAHTTVEAIMPFAAPVLAERQHVADRAQRSSVRRSGPAGQGARTLGEAVAGHLRSANVDPDTVEWDSARREDGRWTLTADFDVAGRSGQAHFTFDAPGNYVVLDNDDARWLIGAAQPVEEEPVRDEPAQPHGRRLSAVADPDELPLGDDSLGDDAVALVNEPSGKPDDALGSEAPLEAYLDDDRPTTEQPAVRDDPAPLPEEPVADERDAEEPAAEEPRPRKRKGRSSVPSWDEIMFGGGDRG